MIFVGWLRSASPDACATLKSNSACTRHCWTLASGDISDEMFWPLWDLVRARAPADDVLLDPEMSLTAAINSAGGYLGEAVIDRF